MNAKFIYCFILLLAIYCSNINANSDYYGDDNDVEDIHKLNINKTGHPEEKSQVYYQNVEYEDQDVNMEHEYVDSDGVIDDNGKEADYFDDPATTKKGNQPTTKHPNPTTKHANPTTHHANPTTKHANPTTKHANPTTKHTNPTTKHVNPHPTTKPNGAKGLTSTNISLIMGISIVTLICFS